MRLRRQSHISTKAITTLAHIYQPYYQGWFVHRRWGVDRLLYGDRADPYVALSRLGRRLEASLAPEMVLPTVVETVGQAMRVPRWRCGSPTAARAEIRQRVT
jgi:hypothetical protein